MTRPLAVLNVVGLSASLLPHAPNISKLGNTTRLRPALPAVTTTVQSSMLTGLPTEQHGIVGNGWYDRPTGEVRFWQRSANLVHGEKIWETLHRRDPDATCLNMFWWYNTHSSCDTVVQVRPIYKSDGRKLPDIYTQPFGLRDRLQAPPPDGLGTFPLFKFWGPFADGSASRWIAEATRTCHAQTDPTLTLVYLPHLDYGLQKLGPDHPDIPHHVAEIDTIVGGLIDYFHQRDTAVLIVSEYGIEPVDNSADPRWGGAIPINRRLRDQGLLAIREEDGLEMLEPGASRAFAVADHQVAHVYATDPAGIDLSWFDGTVTKIDHERAGDLVLVAPPGRWFTYDYWEDDAKAPDYARTVAIHAKPGYDPRELYTDKSKATLLAKLAKKKLGFRQLMDVIPLDTKLVRGTHGRVDMPGDLQPVMIGGPASAAGDDGGEMDCAGVRDVMLRMILE